MLGHLQEHADDTNVAPNLSTSIVNPQISCNFNRSNNENKWNLHHIKRSAEQLKVEKKSEEKKAQNLSMFGDLSQKLRV